MNDSTFDSVLSSTKEKKCASFLSANHSLVYYLTTRLNIYYLVVGTESQQHVASYMELLTLGVRVSLLDVMNNL